MVSALILLNLLPPLFPDQSYFLQKAPPLAKSPPPCFGGAANKGGAFCKWGSLIRCAAGENFEIWDLFFIDFPLEITFLECQNLKIFACGAYEHGKVL